MRIWGVWTAVALGLVGAAKAEPWDLKQISAEAQWVAHVDVDAMRASTLAHKAYYGLADLSGEAERHADTVRQRLGIDLRNDLHGVTAYGTSLGKPEGVLLVHADVDRKALLEQAAKAPDHKATTHGARQLHSWTVAKGRKHERAMAGTIVRPDLIVLAPTVDQLTAALDVLDGKRPSLAGKSSTLTAGAPAGTSVTVRAVGLARAKLPWQSPLANQCETLSLDMGELEDESFAKTTLVAKSAEDAKRLKSIVEGVRAMAEVQHAEDAQAIKSLRKIKISLSDKTLNLEFRAPVAEVWAQLEKVGDELAKFYKNRVKGKSGSKDR